MTPFLHHLYRYNYELNYVLYCSSTVAYYIIAIPKMLPFLDSPPLSRHYQAKGVHQVALVVLILALANLFSLFEYHVKAFKMAFSLPSSEMFLKLLITQLALVGEFIYTGLPFSLSCYVQKGTLAELEQISVKVCVKEASKRIETFDRSLEVCTKEKKEKEVRGRVRELATINSRLHRLNSFPLAANLLTTTISMTVFVCRQVSVQRKNKSYSSFVYICLLFTSQLYLACLSGRTKRVLRNMVETMGKLENKDKLKKDKNVKKNEKSITFAPNCEFLAQYEAALGIQVFDLYSIDYAFQFSLTLFLLAYSVFLLQTKSTAM